MRNVSATVPSQPKNGTITAIDDYNFKYIPDKKEMSSGQMLVTLEITKKDKAFKVDDVDLILEFEQSHESLPSSTSMVLG